MIIRVQSPDREVNNNIISYFRKFKFQNYYTAINVDSLADIPKDYNGAMGVPISFLDKYNPSQFEIVDINPHFFTLVAQGFEKPKQLTLHKVNKKDPYARILIKRK